jgi:putative ABC transport system ATP-binding protein
MNAVPDEDDVIVVEDLERTYHLGEVEVRAIKGVSLKIRRADFLVVTGRNGSGKSTLLHQMGLLDRPTGGRLCLNGRDVTEMREKERNRLRLRDLGYIFQEFALIAELTALENVMLPAMMLERTSRCRERARELLTAVELKGQADHLPSQLSGGEQQKVAIARALMNDPEVIFADEPTANLDLVSAHEVLDIFYMLNRMAEHTIVMVTHEVEETVYGNRLITLSDGKIIHEE